MRINHNIISLQSITAFKRADKKIQASVLRLTTGNKINSSKVDPAGFAISSKLRKQVASIDMAERNSMDGISLLQTAEGALEEITNMIQRIRELAVQAANDVLTPEDKEQIQYEVDSLKDEIDEMVFRTEFNGIKLLYGESARLAYSNDEGISKPVYVSQQTEGGELLYEITKVGVPAKMAANYPFATGAEGKVMINEESADILSTDSAEEILHKLRDVGNRTGVNVILDGNDVYFITNSAGSKEEIKISYSNNDVATAIGILAGTAKGHDAKLDLSKTIFYDENGNPDADFNMSKNVLIDGNRVSVVSSQGRKISFDLQLLVNNDGTYTLKDGTLINDIGLPPAAIPMGILIENYGPLILQVGQNKGMELEIALPKISTISLGIFDLSTLSRESATNAINSSDKALNTVSTLRSKMGAIQNRLDYTARNLASASSNTTEALSKIADTDMAREMSSYTQNMVITQAAISILAQANQRPQQILQLLQ